MTVVLVRADDWIALYLDGIKKAEGHSLSPEHVLGALGIEYTSQEAPEVDPAKGEIVFDDDLTRVRAEMYQ
jgi:hypothetical protein